MIQNQKLNSTTNLQHIPFETDTLETPEISSKNQKLSCRNSSTYCTTPTTMEETPKHKKNRVQNITNIKSFLRKKQAPKPKIDFILETSDIFSSGELEKVSLQMSFESSNSTGSISMVEETINSFEGSNTGESGNTTLDSSKCSIACFSLKDFSTGDDSCSIEENTIEKILYKKKSFTGLDFRTKFQKNLGEILGKVEANLAIFLLRSK